jgi:prevent-host-death family protein
MPKSIRKGKTITALKARQNLGALLEGVYYKGDTIIVERAGKPMAAVVPVWQLEEWQQRREGFFNKVEKVRRKNKQAPQKTIERDVEQAVRVVRKGADPDVS